MTADEYLARIREICARHRATRVVLFGSRAKGLARPNSDFDIAVWGVDDTAPIEDEIDAIDTLFSTDVVNMNSCVNPGLAKEAEDHGIPL